MDQIFSRLYAQGEREEAWARMQQAGPDIRRGSELADALAVARETMRRVRQNIETLIERLRKLDYQFENPEAVHIPPPSDAAERVDEIERLVGGPVPLSLRAWWEEVGEVSFVGRDRKLAFRAGPGAPRVIWRGMDPAVLARMQRGLPEVYADPLALDGVERALAECRESVQFMKGFDDEPFRLTLAPDWLHKADISGGVYAMTLPNAAADALFEGEPHATTLVGYLRVAFRWGGFPGWDRESYLGRQPTQEIHYLNHGLLPI